MAIPVPGPCYYCLKPGHLTDSCPYKRRAADKAEHENRLKHFLALWEAEKISTHDKRHRISAENQLWHGKNIRPMMTI